MVTEVAAAGRITVWHLWKVPIGELQCTLLGIWATILLSSTNNYFPFEKKLLACYWALVEIELLTHQVTIWPQFLIINQVLSEPPSYKITCVKQHFINQLEVVYIEGKPGVLQSMGLQRVGHVLATEQQQYMLLGPSRP